MKSPRERLLTAALLGLIVLAVAGAAGYVLVYSPLMGYYQQAATLTNDVTKLENEVKAVAADAKRLGEVQRRSLPADEVLAKREYAEMMGRLLDQAKAPKGYTITARSADTRAVPALAPKKPAYSLVSFEIGVKKTDLPTLAAFLKGYYQLNLSHQITSLVVKRSEDAGAAPGAGGTPGGGGGFRSRFGRGGGAGAEERKDLDVTMVTQAVIMDGAENRRTLFAVPPAFAAAGGWAGYSAVSLSPEAGRGLAAANVAPVLAPRPREYAMLATKDLFHGPLPPPPKIVETNTPEVDPTPPSPPKPKDKIDRYIRLDGITVRSDGTAAADVRDTVNNFKYQIETGPKGTKVEKFYATPTGVKTKERDYKTPDLLVISDDSSGTNRTFKLLLADDAHLYLLDTKEPAAAVETGADRRPLLALTGGPGVIGNRPPVYAWKVGKTLEATEKLTAPASQDVLKRAAGGTVPVPVVTAVAGQ